MTSVLAHDQDLARLKTIHVIARHGHHSCYSSLALRIDFSSNLSWIDLFDARRVPPSLLSLY